MPWVARRLVPLAAVCLPLAWACAQVVSDSGPKPSSATPVRKPGEPTAAPAPPPPPPVATKVIEFELNGLHYYTQSRGDITVMIAHLPQQVPHYSVLEVSVLNGSKASLPVKPENFRFHRAAGVDIQALPANTVVSQFLKNGSRTDVIKLVTAYEAALYGFQRGAATNGYEQRRQAAMADSSPTRFAAAATASALVFVAVTLKPGDSTDGAIFFPTEGGKPLGRGDVIVSTPAGEFTFETTSAAETVP